MTIVRGLDMLVHSPLYTFVYLFIMKQNHVISICLSENNVENSTLSDYTIMSVKYRRCKEHCVRKK